MKPYKRPEKRSEPDTYPPRFDNFRLTPEEGEVFKKNGFVVSERLGSESFAKAFFRVYRNDLPVFISADALLHAWHRSYDGILEELEEGSLFIYGWRMVKGLRQQLHLKRDEYPKNSFSLRVAHELDYFLEVACSLFSKKVEIKSLFEQEDRIDRTLKNIALSETVDTIEFLGQEYDLDFSLFKPRGHYENSNILKRYFRAMIWLGTFDFRNLDDKKFIQSLAAVLELYNLLKQSGYWETWKEIDQFLTAFLGETDSMSFSHLEQILETVKIQVPVNINDPSLLNIIQEELAKTTWGYQEICSHIYEASKDEPQSFKLPRAFTFLGQRFTLDSWVFSNVVYDRICWHDKKVPRLMPSALDFAFTTLGNCQIIPELVARLTNKQGQKFRDGLLYHHHLAALKEVIDLLSPHLESKTIYTAWLATLRSLSEHTTDPRYPEVMRTRAWAMKTVNTQLASWTQLRHDNILYVKQSGSLSGVCEYPEGFIEPRPEFWGKFEEMVKLAATVIETTPLVSKVVVKQKQVKFLENFAQTLAVLKEMANKELQNIPFNQAEIKFIKDVIEAEEVYGNLLQCTGWYPSLFYKSRQDSDKADPLICDVHTAHRNPEFNYPGRILYQAVGNVDLMLITVENGPDKMVYAGPVLSHYEFEQPFSARLSDSEWKDCLRNGNAPPRPDWTSSYRPELPVVKKLYFDFD
nr:DUF3160 domain-containing protein [Laspinema sp. D2d]